MSITTTSQQDEIARLRNENQQLRLALDHALEVAKCLLLQPKPPSCTKSHFLNLPKELRLSIYEYLVVPGTITIRFNKDRRERDQRYDTIAEPSYGETQLFLVSKQVKDEALPLYYLSNRFICHGLSFHDIVARKSSRNSFGRVIYGANICENVRFVSIAVDFRDTCYDFAALRTIYDFPDGGRRVYSAPGVATQYAHDIVIVSSRRVCMCIFGAIGSCEKLENLQVNLANAYCGMGCCRPDRWFLKDITCCNWPSTLVSVEVMGLVDSAEQKKVERAFAASELTVKAKVRTMID
ncbi:hypothetical protein LTR10_010873 [Elasticomyces elasticus]|nr:hypothetical protein LTR10_010873 [Elasticomyces elasticus]KAK4968478.1 hypothetical protein LTR42_009761 [Elasticomyces elasticus]